MQRSNVNMLGKLNEHSLMVEMEEKNTDYLVEKKANHFVVVLTSLQ